jgi:galactonate dehydratase
VRITDIETICVDRYLFVQVHTDEGITGLGKSGAWCPTIC